MKLRIELLPMALALGIALAGSFGNAALGTAQQSSATGPAAPQPPDLASIPAGKQGDLIRQGKDIFDQTPTHAKAYVGNRLSCNDCHLQGGTEPKAAPLAGVPGLFPQYSQRAGRVISFGERVQECFVRSENGTPPPLDSPKMNALLAYIEWISQGVSKQEALAGRGLVQVPSLTGNANRGAVVYGQRCAVCHQDNGSGVPAVVPALWGRGSYNDGAGMNKIPKMAAFLVKAMPPTKPGSLSPQDAYDVAAYIHGKPRAKFNPAYSKY
ncbi:MAG: c-type cytochrome [Acidobacteriaceae bacterium]